MKKIIFAISVFTLSVLNMTQQMDISGMYASGKSEFFPITLCMNNDDEFTYIFDFKEFKTFHIGSYRTVKDTLFLDAEYEGLDDGSLIEAGYTLKATIDDNKIKMLNDLGEVYVELKRTKKRKKKKVLRECERIRLIANQ